MDTALRLSERPRGIPPSAYARSRSVSMSQVGSPAWLFYRPYRFGLGAVLSREERVEGPSRATLRLGSSSLGKASPRDGEEARFPTNLFIIANRSICPRNGNGGNCE